MTPTPEQIVAILDHFAEHTTNRWTYRRLQRYAENPKRWHKCYWLFQAIRTKTLRADKRRNKHLQIQYSLEEIIAKTLYNFSIDPDDMSYVIPAPFDDDSADFVFPIALRFADFLGISPPHAIPPTDTNA